MLRKILFLLLIPFILQAQDTLHVQDALLIGEGIYKTIYDTVTVQDTTNVGSLALRQVNYGYNQNFDTGETSLSYQAEAHGDSVLFAYFSDGILLKESLQIPNGGVVRDTLKDPPPDSIQVWIHGYWDKWVKPFHQIVPIELLDTLGTSTMALQDIPYATAPWAAPASDLTKRVGYVDLSLLPQSWWDEWDTTDPTKMRVAKDDAAEGATTATELAFDPQEIDTVNQTGHLWFLWSGTLPSTSPDDVRVYPAKSGATSYSTTDTFGRNAVWTDFSMVLHLHEDPTGTAPQYIDATGNGNDGTVNGTVTQATGVVGNGALIGGAAADYIQVADSATLDITGDHSLIIWWIPQFDSGVDNANNGAFFDKSIDNNEAYKLLLTSQGGSTRIRHPEIGNLDNATAHTSGDVLYSAGVYDATAGRTLYQNGSADSTSDTSTGTITTNADPLTLGLDQSFSTSINAVFDEARIATRVFSGDHIQHEYDNISDPATFWGTWTLVNTGGAAQTMSVGLGATTYGLSAASAAGAGMSTQHGISYDLTGAGAASAGMSTSHPISYDLTEGSQASGASSVQLPVSYDLSSASAVTAAMNIQAAISYGMSVSMIEKIKMSVGLGSYTLDLTASGNASAVMQVSQDITYDLSTQMSAQAMMGVSQAISYSLSAAGAAAASMDASMGYSIDMSVTSQTITTKVTLSDGRTFTISAEVRTFTPSSEGRTFTIKSENRTLNIDP